MFCACANLFAEDGGVELGTGITSQILFGWHIDARVTMGECKRRKQSKTMGC
jgi:hypothetical protein